MRRISSRATESQRQHDNPPLGILQEMRREIALENPFEDVSDSAPRGDLYDEPFIEDCDDHWGYDELPPRLADQVGLEEGFWVVGFDGEFIHGPKMLRAKASRPNQPDPVAIDVWNPWTGEKASVMLPLSSLNFSEPPE